MSSADRFGWLARLPWMDDDICDNSVQEGRLWLGYDYRAELTRAFSPIGAGLDTKPVKRLPSRDAPELRHQMVATPTGHLSRQRIAVGSFFSECGPWVWLLTTGQTQVREVQPL